MTPDLVPVPEPTASAATPRPRLRLDKWLWHARFFKTRNLAAQFCSSGAVRTRGQPVTKAHHAVSPGDVLTFPLGRHVRVIRVVGLGERRGPAAEAQQLYEDLAPPDPATALPAPPRCPPRRAKG